MTGNPFYFDGSMSEETLLCYVSRAVTHQTLCTGDPLFNEDIRMIKNIGAKYIGRAAHFSWAAGMNTEKLEAHFAEVTKNAALVHEADPEIILQAGVFEIIYRSTVESFAVPHWVFEAFGKEPEERHFNWEAMLFPEDFVFPKSPWSDWGSRDRWGREAAWPFIGSTEAQMYIYYLVCRYIDCGFEAIHLGQVDRCAGLDYKYYADWDRVTTLARAYAKTHARRGVVLFDCHTVMDGENVKIGDRIIMDIIGAGMVPIDTVKEDGVLKCKICDYTESWCTWVGRSPGGKHPLGFEVETCPTIIELDNYGRPGPVGEYNENYSPWGYDDITWFALQPEWYRNEFLLECDKVLSSVRPDKKGRQVYFLQPQLKRNITCNGDEPKCVYKPSADFDEHIFEYIRKENTSAEKQPDGTYIITTGKEYRANRQSDSCPNGFNQEETIKILFDGKQL